jgi:NTP pyrophosphatase (non-canonical NTP hydrolase)
MWQEEKIELFKKALEKWGNNTQMDMCIEECAELIQAINKFRRNPTAENMKALCSEVADVENMIEQVRFILKKDALIDNIKTEKLERLSTLLIQSVV